MKLNHTQLSTLQRLAALMIPPSPEVDVPAGVLLATMADLLPAANTEFLARLAEALDHATTIFSLDALAQLEAARPEGFAALELALLSAFFAQPEARRAYGYPGQVALDSSQGLSGEDLARVLKIRGPA